MIEDSTRASLADLLTYKDGQILVREVEEHIAREEEVLQDAHVLFFYGSFRKSINQAIGGIVIYDPRGKQIQKRSIQLRVGSNNEAKYSALYKGLRTCISLGIKRLVIKGDALLIVTQILGVWKTKHLHLKKWVNIIKRLLGQLDAWTLQHVMRS